MPSFEIWQPGSWVTPHHDPRLAEKGFEIAISRVVVREGEVRFLIHENFHGGTALSEDLTWEHPNRRGKRTIVYERRFLCGSPETAKARYREFLARTLSGRTE